MTNQLAMRRGAFGGMRLKRWVPPGLEVDDDAGDGRTQALAPLWEIQEKDCWSLVDSRGILAAMWFSKRQRRYLIYTPSFNPFSGGILLLHYLCHLLNELGEQAYLIPIRRTTNPHGLINPKAPRRWAGLPDSVVIYPEVTDHNPLRAKNVVRWLLHKPGFHTGRINHGSDELTVAFAAHFAGEGQLLKEENILTIRYLMDDIYYDRNETRTRCCHSIRKGSHGGNKPLDKHPEDSICIDDLATHQEIAEVFNQSHTFISYDPQSFYSIYASLCGCDSIVIPDDGVEKSDWKSDIKSTYGIAYGFEEVDLARTTRPMLRESMAVQRERNLEMVGNFVRLCERHFFSQKKSIKAP